MVDGSQIHVNTQCKPQEICTSKCGIWNRRCWCLCSAISKWRPFFTFFNLVRAVNHLYLCLTVSTDSQSGVRGKNIALSLNHTRKHWLQHAEQDLLRAQNTNRTSQVLRKTRTSCWVMKWSLKKGRTGKKDA